MECEREENFEAREFLEKGKEIMQEERGKRSTYIQGREVLGSVAQRKQRQQGLAAAKRKREELKVILNEEW